MKIRENEKIKTQTHPEYDDFLLEQFVIEPENSNESIVVEGFDQNGKSVFRTVFQQKFINTHLNILWQDKGPSKPSPEE